MSTDGGNTYSELLEWPRPDQWDISAPEYTFTFRLPFDTAVELRTMAYNEYDKFTESNTIGLEPLRIRNAFVRKCSAKSRRAFGKTTDLYRSYRRSLCRPHRSGIGCKTDRIFHRNHGFDCRNCTSDADSAYDVDQKPAWIITI